MALTEDSVYAEAAARAFKGQSAVENNPLFGLGTDLMTEFLLAEQQRSEVEQRWLNDLRQYKGIYEPDEEARMLGSKAFLKKTRVKVESVDARMMDLLFPANRERNYSIKATPEPSIPAPVEQKLFAMLSEVTGQRPDKDTLKKAVKAAADQAAAKMETRIDDQLAESKYRDVARNVLHSGNLYGTGILKGPLVQRKVRVSYVWDDKEGRFLQTSQSFTTPFLAAVAVWRWYPDMAVTGLEDARFAWEHHRLSKSDMASLAERKTFRANLIRAHILSNPDGAVTPRAYEQDLRSIGDQKATSWQTNTGQYDVFERWGWLDAEKLKACGVEVPDDRVHESFFANLWVLPGGEVIKAVLAPIEGVRWPYYLYYLDKDETSIFGEGLASIMRGDQGMINAAVRMLLDNSAVTSGDMFEVFVPAFPASADLTSIYPGKVFPRTGGDFQYPAVRPISGHNHANELLPILQLFDTNADETTAIPKFTYGDNPRNGAAGTMGGLSMLLGQANIALKDFVISWDEGITKPFMRAIYHWNMKFSADNAIKGDFDVVALGASSLVAKEVRGQALAQFSATLQPEERARIKWAELTQQKANAMDLSDVVMSEDEWQQFMKDPANQQAQQLQQMQQQLQLALLQGQVAQANAKALREGAEAMNKRIEAVYAAMQAAGIAAQSPHIASAGDAILQSAGWTDADKKPGSGAGEEGDSAPVEPAGGPQQPSPGTEASPHDGQRAGIETPEVTQP